MISRLVATRVPQQIVGIVVVTGPVLRELEGLRDDTRREVGS
jgi:hypothetical protein